MVTEAYVSARSLVGEIHDKQLVSTALGISEYVVGSTGDLLPTDILALMTSSSGERIYYRVTGPDRSFLTGHVDLPMFSGSIPEEGGVPVFFDAVYRGEKIRLVSLSMLVAERDINGWVTVQVAQTREVRDRLTREAVVRAILRLSITIGLAVFCAWIGITRGLAPLEVLGGAIKRRSYDDLRKIRHEMPAEISDVVNELNRLLERLKDSIKASQAFISNAAHQLRTPLAEIQAQSELALREVRDASDRDNLEKIVESTRKSTRLANQLLSLATVRPETRGGLTDAKQVDLNDLAARVVLDWVQRQKGKSTDIGLEKSASPALIHGDPVFLQELVNNLIDNAIEYGLEDVRITVRISVDHATAILEVEDNGPGIPLPDRAQVVDRFVRLPGSKGSGCGLGLSIVREIAEWHNAGISLHDGPQGTGLCVRIAFPDIRITGN